MSEGRHSIHAESISIATADALRQGEATPCGRIANDLRALDTRCRKPGHPDKKIHLCFEVGPT